MEQNMKVQTEYNGDLKVSGKLYINGGWSIETKGDKLFFKYNDRVVNVFTASK